MRKKMQESKDEVSPEEIKAFMNEPEPEATPPPAPMGMDDWEGTPENAVNDHKLTSAQIALLAYDTVQLMQGQIDLGGSSVFWSDLSDEQRQYYTGIVNFFINSAANPNGHESCQALHDLVLDAKLRDGWTYGEEYSEAEKKDPILLSYKGLPPHLKARNFLFRCVVVGLVAVWKGH
jgi:hypothetical protein